MALSKKGGPKAQNGQALPRYMTGFTNPRLQGDSEFDQTMNNEY